MAETFSSDGGLLVRLRRDGCWLISGWRFRLARRRFLDCRQAEEHDLARDQHGLVLALLALAPALLVDPADDLHPRALLEPPLREFGLRATR